jgi:hypothetical protein
MEEFELLYELNDRHEAYLIYEGEYRFLTTKEENYRILRQLFDDWRQRIYRFENNLGASVVLYQPIARPTMTWDLVIAQFVSNDPFDFKYADKVASNLRWRDVQQFLDKIKAEAN